MKHLSGETALVLQINFTISYLNLQLWDYLCTEIPICSGEIHIFSGEIPIFFPGFPGEVSMRCSWGIPLAPPEVSPEIARRLSGRHRVLQSRLQEPKGKLRTVRLFLGGDLWMMRIGHTIYIYASPYLIKRCKILYIIYIYISQIYCVNMFNCKPPECKFRT